MSLRTFSAFAAIGLLEWMNLIPEASHPSPNPTAHRKARKSKARELTLLREAEIRQGIGKPPKSKRKRRK